MKFLTTFIEGLIIIEPDVYGDSRGSFFESWTRKEFESHGIPADFVQDNQSYSSKNVLRGLHYQLPPFAQGKLVRVVRGSVLDVAVDIRNESPTCGQHFLLELSEKNNKMLWIPEGFAHGFLTLENDTVFLYKCTAYYDRKSETGIRYDDPSLNILWNIANPVLSEKDMALPFFKEQNFNV